MTNKATIALFAKYNEMANIGMCKVISSLTNDEWNKRFEDCFFKSVRQLAVHIFTSDFGGLGRCGNLRPFKTLEDPYFQTTYDPRAEIFTDKDEYLAKRPELDKKILSLVDEFTDADMAGILKFTTPRGDMERNFGAMQLQYFTHSMHHRGMISVYLELMGKENDYNGLGQAL